MLKWIIGLLDFRLWNGAGQGGGGGGGGGGQGSGGQNGGGGPDQGGGGDSNVTWGGGGGFFGPPAPEPPPPPAPPPAGPGEPGWDWAANRQTANIDRSSQFTHEAYTSALEGIHQQSAASGAAMGPGAYDYELPDVAFGERLY